MRSKGLLSIIFFLLTGTGDAFSVSEGDSAALLLSDTIFFNYNEEGRVIEEVKSGGDKERRWIPMIGTDVRPSYAFSSFRDDVLRANLILDHAIRTRLAVSTHIKYGFSFTQATKEGRFYPDAWQGIGAGLNMFGNVRGLGLPVSVYLFQGAPISRFNDCLSLYYEWNFGASFGWKPCDGIIARSNLIVGSRVNAYINLGLGIKWNLGRSTAMTAGLDLTHFSNGNTSYPNPGVNMAGIRIGLSHSFGSHTDVFRKEIKDVEQSDIFSGRQKLTYDLTIYGALRRRVYRGGETPVLLNGRFAVVGMSFASMWRVGKVFRVGMSADFQWDESSDLRRHHEYGSTADDLGFRRPPFFSQVSVGAGARGELVMPLFSVNVGMGYNFIGPEEARATYQMANLKIRVYRGLFVNIGYQLLDFQRQNNLMLGFGYTL